VSEGPESRQEIYAALRELREEPYGVARSARTEELLEAAERLELDEVRAQCMLELLTAYEYGNELRKAPVLFGAILKLFEAKPEAFDEWATHRVFWCFKWITTSLISLPEIPLASIEGWIAQMRKHYTAAGKPLQAVHTSRYKLAAHTGIGTDTAYELWATRPRDEFSDCEACEARSRGMHWAALGDDERALAEWKPVLDGTLTCSEEPVETASYALAPLVRQGRLDEAASLHRSGYRATRGRVSVDGAVGRHLEFLALTGNTARALELLADNRARFDSTADPETRLGFLGCVETVLRRVVAEGGTDVPVPGPGGRSYTAAALLEELSAQADGIARSFDQRNGTTHVGDGLRERRGLEPLTDEPLPLGIRVAPPTGSAAPTAPAPAPAAIPEDFGQLLAEARKALRLGRPDTAALWAAVAERADETNTDDLLRAELMDRQGFQHIHEHAMDRAAQVLREAAALFDLADAPGRAVSRRARAAWAVRRAQDPAKAQDEEHDGSEHDGSEPDGSDDVWQELDALSAAAEELLAQGRIDAEDYVIVAHSRAATAMIDAEAATADPAARERFAAENEAFRACAVRHGVPSRAALAEAITAEGLAREGRIEAALEHADAAVALAEESDRPWTLPQILAFRARLLTARGRLDEGAADQHRALDLLARWPAGEGESGPDDASILMELATNRMRAGDPAVAISHMTAAAARFDRRGAGLAAVRARTMLAQALLQAERASDAIAVLESVLDEPDEAGLEPPLRAQLRLDLGRALMGEGEHREAAEVLARLAEFVSGWPDPAVGTLVTAELVCALYAASLWEPGEAALERALAAHAEAPNPAALGKALRVAAEAEYRGRGAEGIERALAHLQTADEVNTATEEVEGAYRRWPETALNADVRTQALAAARRNEEALAAAEAAAAAWRLGEDRTVGEFAESMRIAAVVEGFRLGRRQEAATRLAPVIDLCKQAGHTRAVTALSQLQDNLTRESR
jgi:hypothetical protein